MFSKSKTQTQKLAAKLAKKILTAKRLTLNARIIALHGDLGSGKTTFVQGFCKALGVRHGVTSPTFIIMRPHQIPKSYILNSKFSKVFHFDLYRIRNLKELAVLGFSAKGGPALGWKKIISNPENIVLIEWPEKIKKLLPKNTTWIKFEHGKKQNERIIRIRKI